jgi:dipeptidyl aminopeptidase/acylaminoacyl peptidase
VRGAIVACASWITVPAVAAPPPAEAFGAIPAIVDVTLNPDGKRVAWIASARGTETVVMYDLDAKREIRRIGADDGFKLRSVDWVDATTIVITASRMHTVRTDATYRKEFFRYYAVGAGGGSPRMPLMNDEARQWVTGATIVRWRTSSPNKILMSTWDFSEAAVRPEIGTRWAGGRKDSAWLSTLFEVDLTTGTGKLLERGSPFTDQWAVDSSGELVARSEWEPKPETYRILLKQGGGWREVFHQQGRGELRLHGFTADGKAIAAIGASGAKHAKAWAIPLDGSVPQVLAEDAERDVVGLVRDLSSGAPVGARIGTGDEEVRWFDEELAKRHRALLRSSPNQYVGMFHWSDDLNRTLARVDSPSSVPVYYLVDFKARTADIVAEEYPALVDVPLGAVEVVRYEARDGYEIPAHLTTPPGLAPSKLPLVVLPHGGPESRDVLAFDWLAQFLASRG